MNTNQQGTSQFGRGSRSSTNAYRLLAPTLGCLLAAFLANTSSAQSIAVPNHSFESPVAPNESGNPFPTGWDKNPEPPGFDPGGNLEWDLRSGVFRLEGLGIPDGDQAAYLFNTPGIGISQQLTETYQTGLSYNLTVGVHPGLNGKPAPGDQLRLSLSYDNAGSLVPIMSTVIAYDAADFPNPIQYYDYSVDVTEVQGSDAWAGQNITIQFEALTGTGAGTWDLDNVRLTAVPEPSVMVLLAGGLGFGWWINRRRRMR